MTAKRFAVALVAAIACVATASADDEVFAYDENDPAVGSWLGRFVRTSGDSVGALVIVREGDGYSASITALSIGLIGSEVEAVEVDGADVVVNPTADVVFRGTVSDDGQSLELERNESSQKLVLKRMPRPTDLPEPMAFAGNLVAPGGIEIAMTFVFAETPEGNWVGHLDVPAQMLDRFPLINVTRDGDEFEAVVPVPGNPTLSATLDGDTLAGTFRQNGVPMKIELTHDAEYAGPAALARPQHPVEPYPYRTMEVECPHPAGFSLAGTLTIPDPERFGPGPFPTAVLISGSGQQDRDETLLGHKPFLVIADRLTQRGIAVMRYDDRGIGGSAVDDMTLVTQATSEHFATDARMVMERLKSVEHVDPTRIGFVGHSEGGLIGPLVAQEHDDVAFLVLLAGPGVVGADLLELQVRLMLEGSGVTGDALDRIMTLQRKIIDSVVEGATFDELQALADQMLAVQIEMGVISQEDAGDADPAQELAIMDRPWMKYFLAYDPEPVLLETNCPVFAVNGTKDVQVWHEQNLDAIERYMTDAGKDITVKRYEGLNHLFQPSTTGLPAEYASIEITFDEGVLEDVANWIIDKVGE